MATHPKIREKRIRSSRLRAWSTLGVGALLSFSCAYAIFWFNSPLLFGTDPPIIIAALDEKCQFGVSPAGTQSDASSFFRSADITVHLDLACPQTDVIISKIANAQFRFAIEIATDGRSEACGAIEEIQSNSALFRRVRLTETPASVICTVSVTIPGGAKRVNGSMFERRLYISTKNKKDGREANDKSVTGHVFTEAFWVHKGWNSDATWAGEEQIAELRKDNPIWLAHLEKIEPSWILVRHHYPFDHLNTLNIFLSLLAGLGIGAIFESLLTLTFIRLLGSDDAE